MCMHAHVYYIFHSISAACLWYVFIYSQNVSHHGWASRYVCTYVLTYTCTHTIISKTQKQSHVCVNTVSDSELRNFLCMAHKETYTRMCVCMYVCNLTYSCDFDGHDSSASISVYICVCTLMYVYAPGIISCLEN